LYKINSVGVFASPFINWSLKKLGILGIFLLGDAVAFD